MSKAKVKARKGAIVFNDPHKTKQDHGQMADINAIATMYYDGRLPYPENPPLVYGQQTSHDVQENLYLVADLKSRFSELPSDLRDAFDNNPVGYLDWIEENASEVESRGLARALDDWINPEPAVEAENAQNAQTEGATEAEPGTEQHS